MAFDDDDDASAASAIGSARHTHMHALKRERLAVSTMRPRTILCKAVRQFTPSDPWPLPFRSSPLESDEDGGCADQLKAAVPKHGLPARAGVARRKNAALAGAAAPAPVDGQAAAAGPMLSSHRAPDATPAAWAPAA